LISKSIGVSIDPVDVEIFHWIDDPFVPYLELFPEWGEGYLIVTNFCNNFSFEIEVEGPSLAFIVHPPIFLLDEVKDRFNEIYGGCFKDYFKLDKFLGAKCINLDKEIDYEIKKREVSILHSGGRIFKEELKFRMGISFLTEFKWVMK